MKNCRGLLAVALLLLPVRGHASVSWSTDLTAAQKASAASGKPLLIDFSASWCGPCQKMIAETFPAPDVNALLQRMTCVRIDVDQQPEVARKYDVNALPRVLLLSRWGSVLVDVVGYESASEFSEELRRGLGLPIGPAASANAALWQVRQALESNRFRSFKAAHSGIAAAGLEAMVEQLGASRDAEFDTTARLFAAAGPDAADALIHGLENRYLAVRAGSYRSLQAMLRRRRLPAAPEFDPWAAAAERRAELALWRAWWQRVHSLF